MEAYGHIGGLELAKALLNPDPSPPDQPQDLAIPWCVCSKCHIMPTDVENKCCKQRRCVTLDPAFDNLVLNREALAIAIIHRSDFYVGPATDSPESFRKAAYRQYIIWRFRRLGRGNRKVVPSCIVCAVRCKYPSPDGNYLGFREYS